jgi:hypothetical protein
MDEERGRPIKYESPPKVPTEPYFAKVSPEVAARVSEAHGVQVGAETFWQDVLGNREIPLAVAEGEKKALSLLSQGKVAMGIPGIWNAYDAESRRVEGIIAPHPMLAPFIEERQFEIYFDQEAREDAATTVSKAEARLATMLVRQGAAGVKSASWDGSLGKGIDDYIFATGSLEGVKVEEFSFYDSDLAKVRHLLEVSFRPSLELDCRYLPDIDPGAIRQKLVTLQSPKGSGKTRLLERIVSYHHGRGEGAIFLTHLRSLGREQARRLDVPWAEDYSRYPASRDEMLSKGAGLCPDSLHASSRFSFAREEWEARPFVLILDEIEPLLRQMLWGTTDVRKHRVEVLENFMWLLASAVKVYASDADICNATIQFLLDNLGREGGAENLFLVRNSYQGRSYRATVFDKSSELRARMLASVGEGRHFVITHSQKSRSTNGTINLERALRKRYPHLKVLRVDSESMHDPGHPAYRCAGRLNELVRQHDVIVCSPSIQTGVSIDEDIELAAVWDFASGVNPPTIVRQEVLRVRHNCPRYIFCPQKAFGMVGNGSCSPRELARSEGRQFKAIASQLSRLWALEEERVNPSLLNLFHQLAAIDNFGRKYYCRGIIQGLRSEGHEVSEDTQTTFDGELEKQDSKLVRDESYEEYLTSVSGAVLLTDAQFRELERRDELTSEQRLSLRKTSLARRYAIREGECGEITPELVKQDDRQLYPKLRLLYFLSMAQQEAAERDGDYFDSHFEGGKGRGWLPDLNRRASRQLKVEMLKVLGIPELLDCQDEVDRDHPLVQRVAQAGVAHRKEIKQVFNISISPKMGNIQIVQGLLGLLNRKLSYGRRDRATSQRLYCGVESVEDFKHEERTFRRWAEEFESERSELGFHNWGLKRREWATPLNIDIDSKDGWPGGERG